MRLSKGEYMVIDPLEIYHNKINWQNLSEHDKFLALELDGVIHTPFNSSIFTIRSKQKSASWQIVNGDSHFEIITTSGFLSIIPIEDLYSGYVEINLFDDSKVILIRFDDDLDIQIIREQRLVVNSILIYERN